MLLGKIIEGNRNVKVRVDENIVARSPSFALFKEIFEKHDDTFLMFKNNFPTKFMFSRDNIQPKLG